MTVSAYNRDLIVNHLYKEVEGGYSNIPGDHGGETYLSNTISEWQNFLPHITDAQRSAFPARFQPLLNEMANGANPQRRHAIASYMMQTAGHLHVPNNNGSGGSAYARKHGLNAEQNQFLDAMLEVSVEHTYEKYMHRSGVENYPECVRLKMLISCVNGAELRGKEQLVGAMYETGLLTRQEFTRLNMPNDAMISKNPYAKDMQMAHASAAAIDPAAMHTYDQTKDKTAALRTLHATNPKAAAPIENAIYRHEMYGTRALDNMLQPRLANLPQAQQDLLHTSFTNMRNDYNIHLVNNVQRLRPVAKGLHNSTFRDDGWRADPEVATHHSPGRFLVFRNASVEYAPGSNGRDEVRLTLNHDMQLTYQVDSRTHQFIAMTHQPPGVMLATPQNPYDPHQHPGAERIPNPHANEATAVFIGNDNRQPYFVPLSSIAAQASEKTMAEGNETGFWSNLGSGFASLFGASAAQAATPRMPRTVILQPVTGTALVYQSHAPQGHANDPIILQRLGSMQPPATPRAHRAAPAPTPVHHDAPPVHHDAPVAKPAPVHHDAPPARPAPAHHDVPHPVPAAKHDKPDARHPAARPADRHVAPDPHHRDAHPAPTPHHDAKPDRRPAADARARAAADAHRRDAASDRHTTPDPHHRDAKPAKHAAPDPHHRDAPPARHPVADVHHHDDHPAAHRTPAHPAPTPAHAAKPKHR